MRTERLPDGPIPGLPAEGSINAGEPTIVFISRCRIEHRRTLVPLDTLDVPSSWHHIGSRPWTDVSPDLRPKDCDTRYFAKFMTGAGPDLYVPRPQRVTGWRLVTDWVPAPADTGIKPATVDDLDDVAETVAPLAMEWGIADKHGWHGSIKTGSTNVNPQPPPSAA